MFDTIKQNDRMDGAKHFMSFLFSLFGHAAGVCVLAIIPLIFFNAVQQSESWTTWVFGPPPELPAVPEAPPGGSGRKAAAHQQAGGVKINYDLPPVIIQPGIPEPDNGWIGPAVPSIKGVNEGPWGPGIWPAPQGPPIVRVDAPPQLPDPNLRKITVKPQQNVSGELMAARLIRKVEPEYPRIAQLAGISGTVFLEGLIDEEGNVVNLKVVSGNEVLAAAAVNAVKQWKYSPMILTGEPISVTTVIKVIFNIRH